MELHFYLSSQFTKSIGRCGPHAEVQHDYHLEAMAMTASKMKKELRGFSKVVMVKLLLIAHNLFLHEHDIELIGFRYTTLLGPCVVNALKLTGQHQEHGSNLQQWKERRGRSHSLLEEKRKSNKGRNDPHPTATTSTTSPPAPARPLLGGTTTDRNLQRPAAARHTKHEAHRKVGEPVVFVVAPDDGHLVKELSTEADLAHTQDLAEMSRRGPLRPPAGSAGATSASTPSENGEVDAQNVGVSSASPSPTAGAEEVVLNQNAAASNNSAVENNKPASRIAAAFLERSRHEETDRAWRTTTSTTVERNKQEEASASSSSTRLNLEPPGVDMAIRDDPPKIWQDTLKLHNLYRCMHDVPPLVWSDALARSAENYAQSENCQTQDLCNSEHSNKDVYRTKTPNFPIEEDPPRVWTAFLGENLAWDTSYDTSAEPLNLAQATAAWYETEVCATVDTQNCAGGVVDRDCARSLWVPDLWTEFVEKFGNELLEQGQHAAFPRDDYPFNGEATADWVRRTNVHPDRFFVPGIPSCPVGKWTQREDIKGFGGPQTSRTPYGQVGHFTQMVWNSTSHVGCAYAAVRQNVVCHYAAAGNIVEADAKGNIVFKPDKVFPIKKTSTECENSLGVYWPQQGRGAGEQLLGAGSARVNPTPGMYTPPPQNQNAQPVRLGGAAEGGSSSNGDGETLRAPGQELVKSSSEGASDAPPDASCC
ncbi:unnamed protein product [Amoebophrya sp. A120]|nr:unnamed protein product [Amoebophrya sp. A120]|eukprot:GSA120T00000630001.1